MWATLGSGMSDSNTSSATTTRSAGSSSAAVHDRSVVLPEPGGPEPHDRQRVDAGGEEPGHLRGEHVPIDQLASDRNGMPVNLRMFTST